VKQPEIIQEGNGRVAQCRECGTTFRFFPENVRHGAMVYCPREGCGGKHGRTFVIVTDAMKRPAS
jgi:hypothetical protein